MGAEHIDTRPLEPTTRDDIMALQTAASLENLAVSVYRTAAALPFIKDGNATLQEFIATTTRHHEEHAKAFNTAAVQAGGQPQTGTDPKYAAVVQRALPAARTPEDVIALALSLEDVAAQTYTENVSGAGTARLRRLFASVAPVEAQHRATLLTVQSLLGSGDSDLIGIPTDAAALPAAAGTAGFPHTFYPTGNASPDSEGAVR
ncbi:ferritin-like domain-containing protein [Streptomyces sp. NPDC087525]|uniref:ferritin-like domain-containing protein n=1 Tax=Streptomyces sp. NPDC087525 TaxID=3365793 RepID=UPI00382F7F42